MPRINKPAVPNITPQDLKATLAKVSKAVEQSTDANGEVSLEDVKAKLAGDPVGSAALDAIRRDDAFERTETRTSVGCGGGRETHETQVPPKTLKGAEVQSVLAALITARSSIEAKDADHDGRISPSEAKAKGGAALSDVIADRTTAASMGGFEEQMDKWARALQHVRSDVGSRTNYDSQIMDVSGHHAETKLGQQALAWGFRELFADGGTLGRSDMNDKLRGAETSWLRFLPFFDAAGQGHLSDAEIKKHLGTDDLQAFVDDKRAAVERKLGGTWEAQWVTGKNIENADQLDDPDFKARTSSSNIGC